MKFIGLRVFIGILEVAGFLLVVPCLIVIGWALLSGDHPLSGQSFSQTAIAAAAVGGVLLVGVVLVAFAGALAGC